MGRSPGDRDDAERPGFVDSQRRAVKAPDGTVYVPAYRPEAGAAPAADETVMVPAYQGPRRVVERTEPEIEALDAAGDGVTSMVRAYEAQYGTAAAASPALGDGELPDASEFVADLYDERWGQPAAQTPRASPLAPRDLLVPPPPFSTASKVPSHPEEPAPAAETEIAQAYLQERDGDAPAVLPTSVILPDEATPRRARANDPEWWGGGEPETWDGDAPVAVALDGPAAAKQQQAPPPRRQPSGADVFDRASGRPAVLPGLPAKAPPVEVHARRARRRSGQGTALTVSELARQAEQARAAATAPVGAGLVPERATVVSAAPVARAQPRAPSLQGKLQAPRRYPKMLALLRDPGSVPLGSDPIPEPKPPPVPGTFIRTPPEPKRRRRDPAEMDSMLAAMAEGLFVGGDGEGNSEVLITLRDEFFAGTELRVAISEGKVVARLCPRDRETYRHLSAEIHRLRARLEERGLKVADLTVEEP